MGSVGNKSDNNSVTDSFVGKNVDSLPRDFREIKEQFNLDFANDSQIRALRGVFEGMRQYDRGYDEDKTPFNIEYLEVNKLRNFTEEEKQEQRELFGRFRDTKDIYVQIRTVPDSDNAYIRMMDTKYRYFVIGPQGGYYTYRNGKRRAIKSFDAVYGTRELK